MSMLFNVHHDFTKQLIFIFFVNEDSVSI